MLSLFSRARERAPTISRESKTHKMAHEDSAAKRVKRDPSGDDSAPISDTLLSDESAKALRASHDGSAPYTHVVLRDVVDDRLLRDAREEIINNIQATYKETDLFKLFQTGECCGGVEGGGGGWSGGGAQHAKTAAHALQETKNKTQHDKTKRRLWQPGRARPRGGRQAAGADGAQARFIQRALPRLRARHHGVRRARRQDRLLVQLLRAGIVLCCSCCVFKSRLARLRATRAKPHRTNTKKTQKRAATCCATTTSSAAAA